MSATQSIERVLDDLVTGSRDTATWILASLKDEERRARASGDAATADAYDQRATQLWDAFVRVDTEGEVYPGVATEVRQCLITWSRRAGEASTAGCQKTANLIAQIVNDVYAAALKASAVDRG